jgi:predicted dehydrogenase
MLDAGELGQLTYIRLRQAHDWAGADAVPPSFASLALSGGGTLLDNGCHLFDLARYLGGPVRDVQARIATLRFPVQVEDTAAVSLAFENGALGVVETSWSSTGWEQGFWIYGTRGALEFTDRTGRPILRHTMRGHEQRTWTDVQVTSWQVSGVADHTRHVASFLAAVRGERPVNGSGEDGREAVRLVLASYRSAREGRIVRVAETTG